MRRPTLITILLGLLILGTPAPTIAGNTDKEVCIKVNNVTYCTGR